MATWNSGNPIPNPSNAWTDSPIVVNVTAVRKQHLVELREALEDFSIHYHMFNGFVSTTELPDVSFTWADPTSSIVPGTTNVRAQHWLELRTAVEDSDGHYHWVPDLGYNSTTLDLSVPGAWAAGLAADSKPLKTHIDELRTSISLMHDHAHTCCCDSECACTCTCECECQEDCCSECWWFD